MKKLLIALATLACCVLLVSCNKETPTGAVTYTMGFELVTITPEKLVEECTKVENAFISAIQTDLGVTVSKSETSILFNYSGGDTKVRAACEKASLSLQQIPLTGKFIFGVYNGTTAVYLWEN